MAIDKKQIGARIREARKIMGLSQQELAFRYCGRYDNKEISLIESGNINDIDKVSALSSILQKSERHLLFGDNEINPNEKMEFFLETVSAHEKWKWDEDSTNRYFDVLADPMAHYDTLKSLVDSGEIPIPEGMDIESFDPRKSRMRGVSIGSDCYDEKHIVNALNWFYGHDASDGEDPEELEKMTSEEIACTGFYGTTAYELVRRDGSYAVFLTHPYYTESQGYVEGPLERDDDHSIIIKAACYIFDKNDEIIGWMEGYLYDLEDTVWSEPEDGLDIYIATDGISDSLATEYKLMLKRLQKVLKNDNSETLCNGYPARMYCYLNEEFGAAEAYDRMEVFDALRDIMHQVYDTSGCEIYRVGEICKSEPGQTVYQNIKGKLAICDFKLIDRYSSPEDDEDVKDEEYAYVSTISIMNIANRMFRSGSVVMQWPD